MDRDNSAHMLPASYPTHTLQESKKDLPQGVTLDDNHLSIGSVRQRANLTESERLQLVRLCCTRGEEYLQGKERFWVRRTQEFNATSNKNIANARSIVMRMLRLYSTRVSKDIQASGTVFIESELDQALKAWNDWVVRAEEGKSVKQSVGEEEKRDQEQAKMDQENMLLPMSKKRVFREAAAALSDSNETELELSEINEEKQVTKKKKSENVREKKRRLRERAAALDEKYIKQGDCLVEAVQAIGHSFGSGEEELNKERIAGLEKETQTVRKEVAELKVTLSNTSSKVDRILELLTKE